MAIVGAVRERNESAWLLPDRPRAAHPLHADIRRFDGTDQADLVAVGAGAAVPR